MHVNVDSNVDANTDTDPCIDGGFKDIKLLLNKTQNFYPSEIFYLNPHANKIILI